MSDNFTPMSAYLGYRKNKRLCSTASFLKNADMDGYQLLANAIIEQAVKDYRYDRDILKTRSEKTTAYKNAAYDIKRIERFFRSDWFKELTDIDGEWLLDKLREEGRYNK